MRAYYFDNIAGDQRLPHDSGRYTDHAHLRSLGVLHWNVSLDSRLGGGWETEIDRIAEQHGYKNRDTIDVTKEGLGDLYDSKLSAFFEEHMHEDDEIRFILSGSGFFDIREHPSNEWIRIHVLPGDLLVVPAGIYHRFTLDTLNQIKALRLFKEEPNWTPYARSPETDSNDYRVRYIKSLEGAAVA
ncbi:1,2-dihydroxy-3-keto-5-methylthiopentene dioxygenase [Russula earlei]|uniref:1,2-dihydroxy-3-keto-5-methylthiopentene dioxygenase n=1 Tax=Russula earlei TaxID=71964 RepID=A0ACC0TW60_9AGAM|nr:1,2-dihydroxy-3-keto-5-methylthiopentene dioxygenase [Russula earlei]